MVGTCVPGLVYLRAEYLEYTQQRLIISPHLARVAPMVHGSPFPPFSPVSLSMMTQLHIGLVPPCA
jgi:hypothetical protein